MGTTMTVDAQVVYEQHDEYDHHAGPWGYIRVGVRFGDRVIWLGMTGSGMTQSEYDKAEALAKEIVRRCKAVAHVEGGGE